MQTDLTQLRREYTLAELDEKIVDKNPIIQFEKWFIEAEKAELLEPNAFVLSTVSEEKIPSQRTVLLKSYDHSGFVFFTNYESRKAKEIEKNHKVSMLFPWYSLERQVCIQGIAHKISTTESLKYFITRPHGSQLGAWVSHQSKVISSRSILETKWAELKNKFNEGQVPLPDFWGGYRIQPFSIEFWQGRKSRLHDRIRFTRIDAVWKIERLSP